MARGLVLVALAALSWGTTGTVLKLVGATSATEALLVGAIRMLVAAPVLIAAAAAREGRLHVRGWGFALAGLCVAAYQVCFFSAVPLAGVAVTALLAICSAPILVAVLAYALVGEPLTWRRLVALALGIAGAGLLLAGGSGPESGSDFGKGCALALFAGLAYSLYTVITKRAVGQAKPLGLSALTFSVAAIAVAPLMAAHPGETAALLGRGWALLLYLGIIATGMAYWLFATALQRVPAVAAATVGLLEPLTASVLGMALFGEHLGAAGLAGAGLLLGAVVVLAWTERQAG